MTFSKGRRLVAEEGHTTTDGAAALSYVVVGVAVITSGTVDPLDRGRMQDTSR